MASSSRSALRLDSTQLKRQARELLRAYKSGDGHARQRVAKSLPKHEGNRVDETVGADLALTEAQLAIARENGFESWPKLKAFLDTGEGGPSPFERAALAVVNGDLARLREQLRDDPELVRERSPECHRAQLLH